MRDAGSAANDAVCKYTDPGTLLQFHVLPGNTAAPVTLPSVGCQASNTQLLSRRIGFKGETSVIALLPLTPSRNKQDSLGQVVDELSAGLERCGG